MRILQVATALLLIGASLALLVNAEVVENANARLATSVVAVAVVIVGAGTLGVYLGRTL